MRKKIPVWLQNRLISAGLEPVLSNTEKSCIASYYRQFFTNIKIKIMKLAWPLANNSGLNVIFLYSNNRGKLSILQYYFMEYARHKS